MTATNPDKVAAEVAKLKAEAAKAEHDLIRAQFDLEKERYELELARERAVVELDEDRARVAQAWAEAQTSQLGLDEALRLKRMDDHRDHNNNVYQFNTPVDEVYVNNAVATLNRWDRDNPRAPITVVFSSPGGSVFDGMRLFDTLYGLSLRGGGTHEVTTKVQGLAASMASILTQAGDVRVMGKQSFQLIHEVSTLALGSATQLKDEVATLDKIQERVLKIYTERSLLTTKKIKTNWLRKDWWLDADECLAVGLADRVG